MPSMPAVTKVTARSSRCSTSAGGIAPSPSCSRASAVRSTVSSAATSEPAVSRAARLLVRPELGLEGGGDDVFDLAIELEPACGHGVHLAAEAQLQEELGLQPAGQLAQPVANDRDRRALAGALAQHGREALDHRDAIAAA